MYPPNPVDVSVQNQAGVPEPTGGSSTKAKQPWQTPTIDALPVRETYNAPNFNSDGMSGS